MTVFVYREPGLIVQDILQSELDLQEGQVMFTNQPFTIPTDGLFIVVSYVGPSKIKASVNRAIDDGSDGMTETQETVMEDLIQIDMMAYGDEPALRRTDIAMALNSLFSESQQEKYAMQIVKKPGPLMDTSFLEETRMVQRYTTTIVTTSRNMKTKAVKDFYTDFSRAVPPLLTIDA